MNGLFANSTFVVLNESDFKDEEIENMTIQNSRLVLALKDADTSGKKKKARLVAQAIGKINKDKKLFFTYSPTLTRASVRILLCIPTRKGLKIYLQDISQAYVSSDSKLLRVIFIGPPKELGLHPDIFWCGGMKIALPRFDMKDSGV